jgi:hypothetical protein
MKSVKHLLASALFVIFTTCSLTVWSDWINLTGAETSPNIAEIHVMGDPVQVKLEVYVSDLSAVEPTRTYSRRFPEEVTRVGGSITRR